MDVCEEEKNQEKIKQGSIWKIFRGKTKQEINNKQRKERLANQKQDEGIRQLIKLQRWKEKMRKEGSRYKKIIKKIKKTKGK